MTCELNTPLIDHLVLLDKFDKLHTLDKLQTIDEENQLDISPPQSPQSSSTSSSDMLCRICYDDIYEMITLECSHQICNKCLELLKTSECPFCRRKTDLQKSNDSQSEPRNTTLPPRIRTRTRSIPHQQVSEGNTTTTGQISNLFCIGLTASLILYGIYYTGMIK